MTGWIMGLFQLGHDNNFCTGAISCGDSCQLDWYQYCWAWLLALAVQSGYTKMCDTSGLLKRSCEIILCHTRDVGLCWYFWC